MASLPRTYIRELWLEAVVATGFFSVRRYTSNPVLRYTSDQVLIRAFQTEPLRILMREDAA